MPWQEVIYIYTYLLSSDLLIYESKAMDNLGQNCETVLRKYDYV
jgi:hypothetical protein